MRFELQGVSEASERPGFFKRIMETNVPGTSKAYAAVEALFEQLQVSPAPPQQTLQSGLSHAVNCHMYVSHAPGPNVLQHQEATRCSHISRRMSSPLTTFA